MERHALTLAVIIAAATVIIGIQFQRLREARAEVTQVRAELAQLESTPPTETPSALRAARNDQSSGSPPPTATPPPAPGPGPISAPTPSRSALDPAAIRKALELTEDETVELMELLISGGSKADVLELLGAEKFEQYERFRNATARKQQVRQLRDSLEDTLHPLTDAQTSQLDRLLEAEQRREANDSHPKPADPRAQLDHEETRLKAARANAERLANDASRFLDREQSAILRSQLDARLGSQLDSLRTRRARMEIGGQ